MNWTTFAKAVYRIMLRYGLSQMVIINQDLTFKGEFKAAFTLLKIKHHISARGNHNAIFVKCFNRYMNAGLRVFNNDRDTNRVFVEGAETLTYAWNSCSVIGTDLSRSLLTVGHEFKFPIDFVTSNRTVNFEHTATSTRSFATDLTDLMLHPSWHIYIRCEPSPIYTVSTRASF
jgi:hypothetical protein